MTSVTSSIENIYKNVISKLKPDLCDFILKWIDLTVNNSYYLNSSVKDQRIYLHQVKILPF